MNKLNFRNAISDYSIETTAEESSSNNNGNNNNRIEDMDSPSNALKIEENIRKEKERQEPYQMFFYYPQYLHPEAVALIAQNLLNQWEDEETPLSDASEHHQQENQK